MMRILGGGLAAVLGFGSGVALADHIELTDAARRLTAQSLLVDGHNDLPWELHAAGDQEQTRYDLRQRQTGRFMTDIPRLREGGVGAQFWSVYVPVSTTDRHVAYQTTLEQIELVNRMVHRYPDVFELARTSDDVRRIRAAGRIASMIGVEGGHSIESDLTKLRDLYERGARYMTLTHSTNTPWADSATDTPEHDGLTDFGRDVVREMNRLGMFVDISHVSADTMRDVLEITRAPVIASHSSAYAVTAHPRNVPDDVLRRVAANGGVIMVNFYPPYVQHGGGTVDVDTVLDHIDHIVEVAGIDHVGLGSDFDGVERMPEQLGGVSDYPYITQGLLNRGYSDAKIKKILGENLMAAFARMEAVARQLQAAPTTRG
jgi:membrane dipeptidase